MKIKQIIEQNDTPGGRLFDLFIQALIVLSLLCFCVETVPNLAETTQRLLNIVEVATVLVFTIEYFLRILVADSKLRFIFSFYGLIDLCAIAPFYVARGIDLRSIRIFRLFRLIRAFKFLRYSKATLRFKDAFFAIKEELVLFLIAGAFVLFVAAVGIYYFESPAQPEVFTSVFHCLWWAVATLTTVGYGDVYPITAGGKIFTALILIIGIGVVAVPTGLLASALTRAKERGNK